MVAPRISTIVTGIATRSLPHPPAVARGEPERARLIAPFADGEAVASRFPERGGGGQALFLAVSVPENAENRPNRPSPRRRSYHGSTG